MLSFAFPFFNFQQPGIFWPELAAFKPMVIVALTAVLFTARKASTYPRSEAIGHTATKCMFWFVVVQTISVYRSGVMTMVEEFFIWLVYPVFYLISISVITSPAALKRYVWGMICGAMAVVGYGIYAVIAGLPSAVGGRAGAYGMYENHNDYTFVIVQALPFIYTFMNAEPGRLKRWLLASFLVMCVAGVFLSLSRGGMLALVLEILLIVWFTMTRRKKLILIPLVVAIGVAAVGYQYSKRAENQGDIYTAEDAEESRFELWKAGKEMIVAHPFFGVGSRRFGEYADEYAEISRDNRGKNAHNTFIDVAATSGLIGLFLFVKMLTSSWKAVRDKPRVAGDPWVEAARLATMIALATICFRAMFNAKSHDWSFYFIAVMATAVFAMQKHWADRQVASEPQRPTKPGHAPGDRRRVSKAYGA